MAKSIETIINRFDGGVSDDVRQKTANGFAASQHFDIFSNPYRLTPYRSTEADTSTSVSSTDLKQYDVRDFFYFSDGTRTRVYAQGKNGSTFTKLVYKDSGSIDGNWTLPASSESSGAVKYGCLFQIKDKIAGFTGNNAFTYDPASPAFSTTAMTGTITTVANGIIAKDKNGYMAHDNIVVRVTEAYVITEVLTLPANYRITSLENYGNYLAIACIDKNLTTTGKSILFLWDLVDDDVAESIDFGEGALTVIGNIEGRIIGVSSQYLDSSLGLNNGRLLIRSWSGGSPQLVKQVSSYGTSAVTVITNRVIKSNRLHFYARIMTDTTNYISGIWAYGRNNINSNFALSLDYIEPSESSGNGIRSFGNAGNYWFINHSADGSVTKTNDSATFTTTSVYESQKYYGNDLTREKNLIRIGVAYVPLTSGQQVVVKYRKDSETSYTTLMTRTTVGEVSHYISPSIGRYKEVQFRIESTGGAEVSELRFIEEILGD